MPRVTHHRVIEWATVAFVLLAACLYIHGEISLDVACGIGLFWMLLDIGVRVRKAHHNYNLGVEK